MENYLTASQIIQALGRLSELLEERNVKGEICFLEGAAMVLAFNARQNTKDVDALFQPAQIIRELARIVQKEQNIPENWINDAAKGFLSAHHEVVAGDLPQFEHLRLTAPTAEYLLAMKCMASRIADKPEERGDLQDIQFLIKLLSLKSPDQAVEIVKRYYPEERIPARARFVIEDIFDQIGGHS